MNHAIRALIWEQVWKNRTVFPVLILLTAGSAAIVRLAEHAEAHAWWLTYVNPVVLMSFLCCLILAVAPFTLSESHGGWRMNSMVTRWFVLPVPTLVLVLVSIAVVAIFQALVLAAWQPVMAKIFERHFDFYPFLAVWIAGVAALQALAWVVPRRPTQYFPVAAVLFVMTLVMSCATQGWDVWTAHRAQAFSMTAAVVVALVTIGYYAARLNRCGDLAGEISFGKASDLLFAVRLRWRNPRSAFAAIGGSDVISSAAGFCLLWFLLCFAVFAIECGLVMRSQRWLEVWHQWGWRSLIWLVIEFVPFGTIVWLAAGGLYFGCEPGFGFRTRLSSFRATAPVTSGIWAAQRIATPALSWLVVWMPLLILGWIYAAKADLQPAGMDLHTELLPVLARLMVVGAHVVIGALPLMLWGRFDGFPNLFLCAIVVWFAPSFLATFGGTEEVWTFGMVLPLVVWIAAKVGITAWALLRSIREGDITWRFAVALIVGWLVVASLLTWGLPIWRKWGVSGLIGVVVFLPLARLALCPVAISSNRHR